MKEEEKVWRIRPYYKSELAQAYAPDICMGAALKSLFKNASTFETKRRSVLVRTSKRLNK